MTMCLTSQSRTTPEPILPERRCHTKGVKHARVHIFVTADGQEIRVESGNWNIDLGYFVDTWLAGLFKCVMCTYPAFDPVRASCSHLYCRQCLVNLKKKTQNCWLQMSVDTKYNKTTGSICELSEIEIHSYHQLMVACPSCKVIYYCVLQ